MPRGTMKTCEEVKVDKDTVYIRSNIQRVEEEEFSGWSYDEVRVPLREFLSGTYKEAERLTIDTEAVADTLIYLLNKVAELEAMING